MTTVKQPKSLSARFIETVNLPGRYGDGHGGHGLSLNVKPMSNGRMSKSWVQRIRIAGRATNIGLGPYPIVTLAEARRKAVKNRRSIAQGCTSSEPFGQKGLGFKRVTGSSDFLQATLF